MPVHGLIATLVALAVLSIYIGAVSSHKASLQKQCKDIGHQWDTDPSGGALYCTHCQAHPYWRW